MNTPLPHLVPASLGHDVHITRDSTVITQNIVSRSRNKVALCLCCLCVHCEVHTAKCCVPGLLHLVVHIQTCTQDMQCKMVPAAPWCPHTRCNSCVHLAGSLHLALAHTHSSALEQPASISVIDQCKEKCMLTGLPVWPMCTALHSGAALMLTLQSISQPPCRGQSCSNTSAWTSSPVLGVSQTSIFRESCAQDLSILISQ